jgi:hypothetical protein
MNPLPGFRVSPRSRLALVAMVVVLAGCIKQLPPQDRRILEATPVAKLTADDLARDYASDAKGADKRYWGKAVEVSGTVASTRDEQTGATLLFADKAGQTIVEAGLLDDQAKAILAATADSRRVTLKCYCAGVNGHVKLSSCINR